MNKIIPLKKESVSQERLICNRNKEINAVRQ